MNKGKFGLTNKAIAVLAFIFAALNQPIALLLVAGFAFLAEKDKWLNRRCVEALLLFTSYNLVLLAFGTVIKLFIMPLNWADAYKAISFFSGMQTAVSILLQVALIVVCVLAVIRIWGGKDGDLPLFSKIINSICPEQEKQKEQEPEAKEQDNTEHQEEQE